MPVITLDIVVSNLAEVLEFFDRIEVYRSTTGPSGSYDEITFLNAQTAAIVDGSASGSFNLNGLTLQFNLDLSPDPTSVTFTGTNPLDLASIISQINAVVPSLASEVPTNTNQLRLTSQTLGTSSSVAVVASSAATVLGFDSTQINGKERRPRIVDPTTFYKFFDKDGQDDYWYKTRYSNSTSFLTSTYSAPRKGNVDTIVDSSQLVSITATLVDGMGLAVFNRRIIFVPISTTPVSGSSFMVLPGLNSRTEVLTDASGFASASLIRGVTYRVIIEGTPFMREFVVPTTGDTYDLFTISGTFPDVFDIVTTPPRPIKMS